MVNCNSMKKTIIIHLYVAIFCSCRNNPTAQLQSDSTERQEPLQEDVIVQTSDFDSLVTMFPKWTDKAINKGVFESRTGQPPFNRAIPKRMADIYFPLSEEERSVASRYNYSAGYRIDTDTFHILFVTKDLDEHDINDDYEGHPYCSYEAMIFSTKGRYIDKMELARFGDFWSGTLSGTRQPLCLHVEKSVRTDFDGDFTPFPIHVDEIVVRLRANGRLLVDTLRSYISYAEDKEDTDGMFVHQWNRTLEEPAHE